MPIHQHKVEIQWLRSFLAVAKFGSFTRAAQELGREPSAISQSVTKLEQQLGVDLFVSALKDVSRRKDAGKGSEAKSQKKVRLPGESGRLQISEHGRVLHHKASALLDALREMELHFEERRAAKARSPLRVSVGETVMLYHLPRVIARFRAQDQYKKIQLMVRRQAMNEAIRDVAAGDIDLGIRSLSNRALPDELEFEPLVETPLVLLSAKGDPLASRRDLQLEDLAARGFVVPWPLSSTRAHVARTLQKAGHAMRVAMETSGWEAIKQYVALGMGVAVVPAFCVARGDARRVAVRRVDHLFGRDAYGILRRKHGELSRAARHFCDVLRETRWGSVRTPEGRR